MSEQARVRISRVRLKAPHADISILPTRPDPDDSNFVSTLVWTLEQARLGRIVGYAMVFTVEIDGGARRCIESAKAWDPTDAHHVLGLIRRMEGGYIARTWPEDEA